MVVEGMFYCKHYIAPTYSYVENLRGTPVFAILEPIDISGEGDLRIDGTRTRNNSIRQENNRSYVH